MIRIVGDEKYSLSSLMNDWNVFCTFQNYESFLFSPESLDQMTMILSLPVNINPVKISMNVFQWL